MPNKQRSGGGGRSRQDRSGPSQKKSSKKPSRQASASERTAQPRRTSRENTTGAGASERTRRNPDAPMDEEREASGRSGVEEADLDAEDTVLEFADDEDDEEQ